MNPQIPVDGCLILDGGLATELEARGHDLNDRLWSARLLRDAPEEIAAVHRDYLQAGADGITTASYQATVAGFVELGMGELAARELIRSSVRLAKSAVDDFWSDKVHHASRSKPFVAASIGPYGAFLANGAEFSGDYHLAEAELISFHHDRWDLLCRESPDVMLCETIPSLREARALARVASKYPEISVWLSFSCGDERHVCDGTSITECARFIDRDASIQAIGVNCTAPKFIGGLIQRIRQATSKPIVVYPNSGEIFDVANRHWSGVENTESLAQLAGAWWIAGARVIGGCCRTTPADIAAIRQALNDRP